MLTKEIKDLVASEDTITYEVLFKDKRVQLAFKEIEFTEEFDTPADVFKHLVMDYHKRNYGKK